MAFLLLACLANLRSVPPSATALYTASIAGVLVIAAWAWWTLRLLNDFGIPEIYTPSAKSVVHDNNPAWKPFALRLSDNSPPNVKSIELPEEVPAS